LTAAYRTLRLDVGAGVATVTLDRPERLNILGREALVELADALGQIAVDVSCRAVVLRSSSERGFTAGADIREMRALTPSEARGYAALGHGVANFLEREVPPVILAANGFVMGGGVELACACDFRLASEDAVFAQPEINIGIFPGWGGSQRLARIIGLPRARELILTGRRVTAREALTLGLVHGVVPREELHRRAQALAAELASKSRPALLAAKRALNNVSELPLAAGLEDEQQRWALLFGGDDPHEGMAAFLERREPRFREAPPRPSG
jgi:enoyl-CoA hydratase